MEMLPYLKPEQLKRSNDVERGRFKKMLQNVSN